MSSITKGYKKTEVGVIPEEWGVKKIGEILRLCQYGSAAKSELNGTTPVLRMGNLDNGLIDWDDLVYTSNYREIQNYSLCKDDILFNRTNSPDLVGKTAIYHAEKSAIFAGYLIRLQVNTEVSAEFLNRIMNSAYFKSFCKNVKTDGVSQSNINANNLKSAWIPLPPLPEQKAIAEVLSDMDALIEVQKELIAKKRDIKQGAMQDLLSGRVRLPGYETKDWKHTDIGDIPNDWAVKELGAFSTFLNGIGFPIMYQGKKNGDLPFCKVSDMNLVGNEVYITRANNYISYKDARTLHSSIIPRNSIIFAKVGAALLLNRRRIVKNEICIDNNMMSLTPNQSVDLYYIYQNLMAIDFADYAQEGALPSINSSQISKIPILFPPLLEQQAIAQVLSDMDDELETLEAELEKLYHMKRGMMQELLTGRIRLI